jgi:hypothetical protein
MLYSMQDSPHGKNIRESKEPTNIHSTAGTTKINLIGDLPGYGTVWYLPGGIANILLLARVLEKGYIIR